MEDHSHDKQQEIPRSSADYANYSPPEKKSKMPSVNWRKPAKYLLALLLLVGVGAGIYTFVLKAEPASDKAASPSDTSQTGQSQAGQIASATENYSSQEFALSFDYPEDWMVVGGSREELKVISPDIKLKTADGQMTNGQIVMYIRAPGQKIPGLDSRNATAVMGSKKIRYAKPTANQRGETYISFLRYAGSSFGLDAVFITGNNGYQKDQSIPRADIEKVEPMISITFGKCADSGCVELAPPMSIDSDSWNDMNLSQPLEAMLQSLVIN